MPTDPAPPPSAATAHTGSSPPDPPLVDPTDLGHAAAQAFVPLAGDPRLHRPLIQWLARTLRQDVADSPHQLPLGPVDAVRRALALAVTAMLPRGGASTRLAELRLFTRLTLGECAEVLQAPRALLAQIWRTARLALFARTRLHRLTAPARPRFPSLQELARVRAMASASVPPHDAEERFADDLRRAAEGDSEARKRLWDEHYPTLLECAKGWFAQHWQRGDRRPVSLTGTEVTHQVYQRLVDRIAAMERGKTYFFRVFYNECRRVVVDHWRRTEKHRGRGQQQRVELTSELADQQRTPVDVGQLYELCTELERQDARLGQVAMFKVFEDLTDREVAELLGIGLRTVQKDWAFAKAWLKRRIDEQAGG